MISKTDALKVMEKTDHKGIRIPFGIAFITADRNKWEQKKRLRKKAAALSAGSEEAKKLAEEIVKLDTGGRIIEHGQCVLSGTRGIHAKNKTGGEGDVNRKNPGHWENRTRNVVFLPSNEIRKCHISLITRFNGREVIY